MLKFIPVSGYRAWGRFIQLPWSIYADDPNWIAPLKLERRVHFSKHNPYFEHAQWCAWIAYRGKRPVGRICAQVDQLRLDLKHDNTGSFGMLEAIDDAHVIEGLLRTAENWLIDRGMSHVEGPYNLSINDECGLLVEGFETPPYIMMGHAREYYAAYLEQFGYRKANDIVSYRMHPNYTMTPVMQKIVDRSTRVRKGQFTLRSLRRKDFDAEIELLRDIFNEAWSDNWGFLPFTEAEFNDVGTVLKSLVHEDYIKIGEIDGKAVSFIVALPNINEAIRDLNGRLLPLRWIKFLWRMKVMRPKTLRVALMGVRKNYQQGLTGSGISLNMIDGIRQAVLDHGGTEVEMGWILEQNKSMRSIIESIGGKLAKRYRIYTKQLQAPA